MVNNVIPAGVHQHQDMFIVLYTRKPIIVGVSLTCYTIFLHEHVLPGTNFNPAFSVVKLRSASTFRLLPAILCQVLSASCTEVYKRM
jgi:hypothetical protein